MIESLNPYTVHSGDEFGGCEWYSVLKGPEGFECWFTEPEDRNWWREGEIVVEKLNAYHTENAQLKADIDSYKMTIAGYVKAEELYRLEIKALISVRGQMEQGAAMMSAEINQLKAELAQAKVSACENYDFLIQSRDCILHEFCLLQVTYGEQKHELRNLKAELAQAKAREARLRECLQKGLGPFVNDPYGFEAWYGEATVLVQEAGT